MDVYVYADVLFLLNFCMDFVIIKTAAGLLRKRAGTLRLLLGAGLAALVYCVFFCLGASGAALLGLSAAGLLAGLLTGFGRMRLKEFIILSLTALAAGFGLGGGCMAVYYSLFAPGRRYEGFPVWLLAAAAAGAYICVKVVGNIINRRAAGKAAYTDVNVGLLGKEAVFTALIDTGHGLREPISRQPVLVAELNAIKTLLPDAAVTYFENGGDDIEKAVEILCDNGLKERVRLIPYRSIGERGGLLVGFRPDYIQIKNERRKGVVAVYTGRLSDEGAFCALINPEMTE